MTAGSCYPNFTKQVFENDRKGPILLHLHSHENVKTKFQVKVIAQLRCCDLAYLCQNCTPKNLLKILTQKLLLLNLTAVSLAVLSFDWKKIFDLL